MFRRIKSSFQSTVSDRKGVTALEYGVIAAATIVVGLATFGTIGTNLATIFGNVKTALGG